MRERISVLSEDQKRESTLKKQLEQHRDAGPTMAVKKPSGIKLDERMHPAAILATVLFLIGVGYIVYLFSPIPQCSKIASILDDVSDNTVFDVRWSISDEISCAISPQNRRDGMQASAEVFRFNAYQLKGAVLPK